jgi:hypothetical protein
MCDIQDGLYGYSVTGPSVPNRVLIARECGAINTHIPNPDRNSSGLRAIQQLDLEYNRPLLPGNENPVMLRVIGNSIQD